MRERNDSWGDAGSEANVLAAWLARFGALAIVLGAAFAFKLAIDRGLIGPGLRVVLGVAAGLSFIGVGELARRRNQLSLSQALCAAGVVLLYLSILAGLLLYALLPPALALGLLIVVATAGGFLGIFHDSIALGALSALGGPGWRGWHPESQRLVRPTWVRPRSLSCPSWVPVCSSSQAIGPSSCYSRDNQR